MSLAQQVGKTEHTLSSVVEMSASCFATVNMLLRHSQTTSQLASPEGHCRLACEGFCDNHGGKTKHSNTSVPVLRLRLSRFCQYKGVKLAPIVTVAASTHTNSCQPAHYLHLAHYMHTPPPPPPPLTLAVQIITRVRAVVVAVVRCKEGCCAAYTAHDKGTFLAARTAEGR